MTDYFDGISDLKNQKVKFIGDANQRIEEDFLRILRFFRFSCRYAHELDSEGLKACVKQKSNLKKLSRERVRAEILKMICGDKKQNLLAVLQVLKSKKIADEIFSSTLDLKALEHLFEFEEKLHFSATQNLKIATLFLQKETDLKILAREICVTNSEKKFFLYLQTRLFVVSKKGTRSSEFDLADLKQLLVFDEKKSVLDLYLFSLVKNFDSEKISAAKKNLQFLQNFSLPNFPISSEDVLKLGFIGKGVGEAIELAKKFWAQNNFHAKKTEIIKLLEANIIK